MKNEKLFAVMKETELLQPIVMGLDAREIIRIHLEDIAMQFYCGDRLPQVPKNVCYVALLTENMLLADKQALEDAVNLMEEKALASLRVCDALIVRREYYNQDIVTKTETVDERLECYDKPQKSERFFRKLRAKTLDRFARSGVIILSDDCILSPACLFEEGVVIEGGTALLGRCKIGKNSLIGAGSTLENTETGENVKILSSRLSEASIGAGTTIGPFAYLRGGVCVGENCRIGDFVEIKHSTLENDVKAAHLTYIGDAYVGEKTNVGCGTVFVNYNGKIKQQTKVGKRVFIGSNSNLIAPLSVGDDAFIAAGSTVTDDIPAGAFCIARERQIIKENWKLK